jgi:DNA-binding Lrp family transcriptional regulator
VDALAAAAKQADIVVAAYELSGPFDILLHVVAPEMKDWRRFEQALTPRLGDGGSARMSVVVSTLKPHSPSPTRMIGEVNARIAATASVRQEQALGRTRT